MNNFTRSGYKLPGKSGNGIAILLYPNPQVILSVRTSRGEGSLAGDP
jgi:hypothetical protein